MQRPSDQDLIDGDDPVSIVVEAVVRLAWLVAKATVGVVVSAFRHPMLTVVSVALGLAGRLYGVDVAFGAITVLVSAGLLWRIALPRSYARWGRPRVAPPLLAPWYRNRWPGVASRTGLVAYDHDPSRRERSRGRIPRLRRVRVTPSGVHRLLLELPHGITPAIVADRTDAISHGLRCRDVRILEDRPGRVWLELHRSDVLAPVVEPLRGAAAVDLAAVVIGRHEDGTHWRLRLAGTHVLIAGVTGSGKGSVLWSLLHALGPSTKEGVVQIWAIDPKGGMELRPGRRLFTRFEDGTTEAMCEMLEDLVRLKDERARSLAAAGARSHVASQQSPHILLVVDELATLTAFAERNIVRRIEHALGLLLTQGRACGLTVIAAVQDPGKDVVVWRDLFPTRIALRLDNPIQVDMVLGDGAADLGARADRISELTPGVGYVRVEGTRAVRRVRASYVSDQEIPKLVSRGAPICGGSLAPTQEGDVA